MLLTVLSVASPKSKIVNKFSSPNCCDQLGYRESVVISYAQNLEDVVLFRLTRFVDRGFYVDVGAAHPVIHNVTYALYQAGWHGINIEPMKPEAEMLMSLRPRDITINAAAGAVPGVIRLFAAPLENRGATTFDPEIVKRHVAQGQEFEPFESRVITVSSLIREHEIEAIHILKIDVEGAERDVLLGSDLSELRPWVVVVESTRPNTTEDVSHEWIDLLGTNGYVLCLFDGLNKFFVRGDLTDIQHVMRVPANVFDDYQLHEVVQARETLAQISNFAKESEIEAAKFAHSQRERAERAEEYATSLEVLLNKSTGWVPARDRD